MKKIKKVYFFLAKERVADVVDKIYDLVRSHQEFLRDTHKLFATKLRDFSIIMASWGWAVDTDHKGNIVSIVPQAPQQLLLDSHTLTAQRKLFEEIAPLVEKGSFIYFEDGDNGLVQKWSFDGKNLIQELAP